MVIEDAVEDDFLALLDIGRKFFELNPYRHCTTLDGPSLMETFFQLQDDHILLVVRADDGSIIGTAGAFIGPVFWNQNYLQGLEVFWWIDPQHRQNGLGKELREFLQYKAKTKGVHCWNMVALTESMPDVVDKIYRKDGFTPVETIYMKVL